jgi:histidinol-phosphate phosphatase family protein
MLDLFRHIDESWTLFLDRDGVVNQRIMDGYVQSWEGFHLLPGVLESMAVFSHAFGKIIMVTNQQGVGKKLMDEAALSQIHEHLKMKVQQAGGRLDAIYYCPDLASKPDNCRKPGIAMALQAKKDFPEIDFSKSIMVGDSESDMQFGKNAGMYTVFVGEHEISGGNPDLCVGNLFEFSQLINRGL